MNKVPFFANIDDNHCFQAALQIILAYFLPDKQYSVRELEEITAKLPGMWTWPQAGLVYYKIMDSMSGY